MINQNWLFVTDKYLLIKGKLTDSRTEYLELKIWRNNDSVSVSLWRSITNTFMWKSNDWTDESGCRIWLATSCPVEARLYFTVELHLKMIVFCTLMMVTSIRTGYMTIPCLIMSTLALMGKTSKSKNRWLSFSHSQDNNSPFLFAGNRNIIQPRTEACRDANTDVL